MNYREFILFFVFAVCTSANGQNTDVSKIEHEGLREFLRSFAKEAQNGNLVSKEYLSLMEGFAENRWSHEEASDKILKQIRFQYAVNPLGDLKDDEGYPLQNVIGAYFLQYNSLDAVLEYVRLTAVRPNSFVTFVKSFGSDISEEQLRLVAITTEVNYGLRSLQLSASSSSSEKALEWWRAFESGEYSDTDMIKLMLDKWKESGKD